ncbi:lamin tail domain-containing protein [Paraflavitalea pollutisoli]|uniref:lamin tail domain-containing protein n=1 Tax=Paraflavitalea pollutisoli TaxID=3034143 RepID=UPI0023EC3D67|nr:lamin tail domain-containing protein [Paraflavitalea sp. H1-2-19X]
MSIKLLVILLALPATVLFAQPAQRYEVLITELMPDPTPPVGLPNHEFIELTNVSARIINLKGWKLSDGAATATINQAIDLQSGARLIVCPNSAVMQFEPLGPVAGVSNFPSLNNDADVISLYAPDGSTVHTVAYTDAWYQNSIKIGGGWSLEMIDLSNPCGNNNWKAAIHASGGTPGAVNSVQASNPDEMPPALINTYSPDSLTVVAIFDESLDSLVAAQPVHYQLDGGKGQPVAARPQPPLFREVVLEWATPLPATQVLGLTVKDLTDCSSNTIGMMNHASVGLPQAVAAGDVVINELLFNPPPDGADYIELYNRSRKIIDCKQLYIANRSATGKFTNVQQLTSNPHQLYPGEYRVLTENASWLLQHYPNAIGTTLQPSSIPSLPDDRGVIVVMDQQEVVIDELHYDKNWHSPLLGNEEGVALERIDYSKPGQHAQNWMSAAATAGFGTPGLRNSQFRADLQAKGAITVSPAVFSPDNDGIDDYVTVQYQAAEPGCTGNIILFTANGVPVRHLARNALLGREGTFRWDGMDNNRRQLPLGTYIMYTEIFDGQGKTKKFRNTVTLARRL